MEMWRLEYGVMEARYVKFSTNSKSIMKNSDAKGNLALVSTHKYVDLIRNTNMDLLSYEVAPDEPQRDVGNSTQLTSSTTRASRLAFACHAYSLKFYVCKGYSTYYRL